jgi:hypothetical protein
MYRIAAKRAHRLGSEWDVYLALRGRASSAARKEELNDVYYCITKVTISKSEIARENLARL